MCLLTDSGVVYFALDRIGITRNKHVRVDDNDFSRLGNVRPAANQHEDFDGAFSENYSGDATNFECLQSFDSECEDIENTIRADALTYVSSSSGQNSNF